MPLFRGRTLAQARRMSDLVYCNPFLEARIEHERAILGSAFDESTADWNIHPDWANPLPNIEALASTSEAVAQQALGRIRDGYVATDEELALFEDVVLLGLYYRLRPELDTAVASLDGEHPQDVGAIWQRYLDLARPFVDCLRPVPSKVELARIFAFFFQFCRAFHRVFDCIIGASEPAVELRAAVWQSIFTHDLRRYRRGLYERMGDYATLITGPSGTGKEIVARAIGESRYVPFDPRTKAFVGHLTAEFYPLNLSALSSQLIEGELFGHKRGAFTGAVGDRKGWLESCGEFGAVFLDEMGEIEPMVQVKLLRLLENRTFHRVGETKVRRFAGKVIAATNRDMAREMQEGRFRPDLYYRICADTIRTPSLRERISGDDAERRQLLAFLAQRLLGEDCADLVAETEEWIDRSLGRDYAWPGNVRELEQCLRNVLIRREYHPEHVWSAASEGDAYARFAEELRTHRPPAHEVLRKYCRLVYRETGTFERAAQRLQLDRRTVRSKVGDVASSES